jgi:hypothetical protein
MELSKRILLFGVIYILIPGEFERFVKKMKAFHWREWLKKTFD